MPPEADLLPRDARDDVHRPDTTSTSWAPADPVVPAASPRTPRMGYVLKMYPRFSETFILTELLAHEARGIPLDVLSLRRPDDGHFHAEVARLRADVTYVDHRYVKSSHLWERLRTASDQLDVAGCLDDLLREDVDAVLQAIDVAELVVARGLVHLHAHFGSVATTVARLAARLAGITYSFTAHAKDIFHESVDPADLGRKLADAQTVVTISAHNLDHLRTVYGDAANGVTLVRNGLALDRFDFLAPHERRQGDVPVVAAVGRLVEKKGFADLVTACRILADRGVAMQCRIVGDGVLAEELAAQVERLDLADRVHLVGPRPQDDVRVLLHEARVFAAPCVIAADDNRDGLPTVLLEAMAMGTPSVATPVTGIPEAVDHELTGLLVPPHEPVRLADAIQRALEEPGLGDRLARRARDRVEADFDAQHQAAAMWEAITAHLPSPRLDTALDLDTAANLEPATGPAGGH